MAFKRKATVGDGISKPWDNISIQWTELDSSLARKTYYLGRRLAAEAFNDVVAGEYAKAARAHFDETGTLDAEAAVKDFEKSVTEEPKVICEYVAPWTFKAVVAFDKASVSEVSADAEEAYNQILALVERYVYNGEIEEDKQQTVMEELFKYLYVAFCETATGRAAEEGLEAARFALYLYCNDVVSQLEKNGRTIAAETCQKAWRQTGVDPKLYIRNNNDQGVAAFVDDTGLEAAFDENLDSVSFPNGKLVKLALRLSESDVVRSYADFGEPIDVLHDAMFDYAREKYEEAYSDLKRGI